MNRNYIASELAQAAKEMTAGDLWSDMPDRVGKFVKNRSRAMRDDETLEYVSLDGFTVLFYIHERYEDRLNWDIFDNTDRDDSAFDAGVTKYEKRTVANLLKILAKRYVFTKEMERTEKLKGASVKEASSKTAGALSYMLNGRGVSIVARSSFQGNLTRYEANHYFDKVEELIDNAVKMLDEWTRVSRELRSPFKFKRIEPTLEKGYFQGVIRAEDDDEDSFIAFLEKNGIKKFR